MNTKFSKKCKFPDLIKDGIFYLLENNNRLQIKRLKPPDLKNSDNISLMKFPK